MAEQPYESLAEYLRNRQARKPTANVWDFYDLDMSMDIPCPSARTLIAILRSPGTVGAKLIRASQHKHEVHILALGPICDNPRFREGASPTDDRDRRLTAVYVLTSHEVASLPRAEQNELYALIQRQLPENTVFTSGLNCAYIHRKDLPK